MIGQTILNDPVAQKLSEREISEFCGAEYARPDRDLGGGSVTIDQRIV
jgi:hypothetical protein